MLCKAKYLYGGMILEHPPVLALAVNSKAMASL